MPAHRCSCSCSGCSPPGGAGATCCCCAATCGACGSSSARVGLGALVAPGMAFSFEGRLSGALWPIPPTQVAHYAAVLFGTTAVLWMCRVITGRQRRARRWRSGAVLVGTHTRTALIAMLIGLVVAGASLFLGHARVRRTSAGGGRRRRARRDRSPPQSTTWARGPDGAGGRPADRAHQGLVPGVRTHPGPWSTLFGSGLSNKSFNGLPIDSNWVATFLDQGWFGIFVEATFLLLLLLTAAYPRARPAARGRAVPRRLLPGRLDHRDRARRRVAVPARPRGRGGLLAAATVEVAGMKVMIVHGRYRSAAPSGENHVVDQEARALARPGTRSSGSSGTATTSPAGRGRQGRAARAQRLEPRGPRGLAERCVRPSPTSSTCTTPSRCSRRRCCTPAATPASRWSRRCTTTSCSAPAATSSATAGSATTASGVTPPRAWHGCYRGLALATVPVVAGMRAQPARLAAAGLGVRLHLGRPARPDARPRACRRTECSSSTTSSGARATEPSGAGITRCVYVGRLDEAKGVPFLMRAWDAFRIAPRAPAPPARRRRRPARPTTVPAWAARHPSVDVPGWSPGRTPRACSGARLPPSCPPQWEETFGLVAVEAMAAGVAPIAPARGRSPSWSHDGVDGALFRRGRRADSPIC